jgi:hypothetical protein
LILELNRAQVPERGMESAGVVDGIDEPGKVGGDVFEGLIGHQVPASTFKVLMNLSALALL